MRNLVWVAMVLSCGMLSGQEKDLIAYWSFDHDTVEELKSSVGNYILTPRCPRDDRSKIAFVEGVRGKAIEFKSGNRIHYALPPFVLTDLHPPFTIACWIKKTEEEPKRAVICATSSDPFTFGFEFAWMWKMAAFRRGDRTRSLMAGTLEIQRWHHLAVVHDGKKIRMFADAKMIGEKDFSTIDFPPVPKDQSGNRFTVGNYPTNWNAYGFIGLMDDLFLYSRALSEEEIGNLSIYGIVKKK